MDGGSIGGTLFVVFLVLKLVGVTRVAHWSWWWVFSPLWIDAALTIVVGLILAVFGLSVFGLLKKFVR
jgi:hypothetical protein